MAAHAVLWSRLVVWIAGLGALALFGKNRGAAIGFDPLHFTEPFRTAASNFALAPTARWDSAWYLHIAHSGYFSRPSSAFFPLYPMLIRAGTTVSSSPLVIATLISIASMTVGLYMLHRLTALDLGETAARTTVLLVAFFPTAFFLSAVYTESLYLMLSVAAIYAARTERWAWAGLLGGLAGATRSNGILIAVPLVLLYLYGPRLGGRPTQMTSWWRPRYRLERSALWLAVIPAGLLAYLGYLAAAHGAPLAPFEAQGTWQRHFAGPFGALVPAVSSAWTGAGHLLSGTAVPLSSGDVMSWSAHNLVDLGFVAVAAAALALSWRRVPFAYFAYAVVLLAHALSYPVSLDPAKSFPRYALVIFPLFMGCAARLDGRKWLTVAIIGVSGAGLAAFSGLWAMWDWVA